ncbi:hypothetical protein LEP1GSC035_2519 [Leptospira noguchii str. 2007001578]|uniref:Uncharacterized protein n=1 Tax=Leptospira noguchii str. 2007001578 TaxID=1049974 RepID=A0ABN0J695_9LEPT|nr:hypothetical protein LEP1GSC035_2519 [Leptospira noguchii str. 2007001578]
MRFENERKIRINNSIFRIFIFFLFIIYPKICLIFILSNLIIPFLSLLMTNMNVFNLYPEDRFLPKLKTL